jgi:hypothetical protein
MTSATLTALPQPPASVMSRRIYGSWSASSRRAGGTRSRSPASRDHRRRGLARHVAARGTMGVRAVDLKLVLRQRIFF